MRLCGYCSKPSRWISETSREIFVAGGFGAHLDIEKAIFIGLLPDIPKERIRFIGNSSLAGARLALLSVNAFHRAEEIANRMTYIELSVHPEFMNEFIASLFLPHTDMELFPTVKESLGRKHNGFKAAGMKLDTAVGDDQPA